MEENLQYTFLPALRALIKESYPECIIHENVVTAHTGFGFTVDEPSFCAERLELENRYELRIRTFHRTADVHRALVESECRCINTRLLISEQVLYDFVDQILPLPRPQSIPIEQSAFAFLFSKNTVTSTK